jgi:predicted alpha/beta-hydrolase family hydrolase
MHSNTPNPVATLLLAHGAGAPMDSPFMEAISKKLVAQAFEVIRFEFPYMQQRRKTDVKRPPDRAEKLMEAFHQAISAVGPRNKLIIGGKSMGGRIASMLAANHNPAVQGVLCLGYPFHPPGKREKLRTDHLPAIKVPTLIIQGERDTFGGRTLVETLSLPHTIKVVFAPDGNHDLTPRKASGHTAEENMDLAVASTKSFFCS